MSDRGNSCCNNSNTNGLCSNEVCIQTCKVYDSCRDKECIENLRVYLTESGQSLVDRATSIRCRKAEVIWVYSDVEPVAFNRGYYSVDLKIFFRIALDVFTSLGRPTTVEGIATYDKKVILFGSEGNAKTFSSAYHEGGRDIQYWAKNNLPVAQIDVCVTFFVSEITMGEICLSSCVSIRTRFGCVFLRHCIVKILANASAFTAFLPPIVAKTQHRKFFEPKTR